MVYQLDISSSLNKVTSSIFMYIIMHLLLNNTNNTKAFRYILCF